MAFALDRLSLSPMVDKATGRPLIIFQRLWQKMCETIEAQENTQDAIIARIRRINSHTIPTTILSATENGVSVTIEVLNHTRVYADGTTLAITGDATVGTGLLADTIYGCYYDDTTLADTTPAFVFTSTISDAQAAAAEGRHFCGCILTPSLASGDTIESGGAYPMGSSVGGEL
jgi:hypothetical protein